MDVAKNYKLSMYQDYGQLDTKEHIHLVRDKKSGQICVKKTIDYVQRDVIEFRKNNKSCFFPEIYEVIEEGDTCIIVEEYINGVTLEEYMMGNPLPEEEAIAFGSQICKALTQLHKATPMIVYRDLKPENIVITKEKNVKLVDFNISRSFQDGKKRDTILLGTAEYAAPEQFGYFQTDNRTDIYAFGVLFNYMLTAKFPVEYISEGKYKTLILKCIELEPSSRYQSIEEVKKQLVQEEDEQKVEEKQTYSWAIPGFRNKTLWKKAFAIMGYIFICYMCLDMDFQQSNGEPYEGLGLWLNRILMLSSFLGTIFFCGNYRGISSEISFYQDKRKIVRWIAYVVTWFILFLFVIMLFNLISDILHI